jgi:UDP-GlcNAc:undecaprenyl-phosphate GlcNAc-1-phosphate transferase
MIALRRGIVDKPDNYLKPHERPIPYLGGVAVFAGWVCGLMVAILSSRIVVGHSFIGGIALAGLAIMLIGLFDDLRVMSPSVKLACNLIVAAWLLYLGLGTRLVHVATDFMRVELAPQERWLELAYSVPVALLIIVGACNAANLIDGLDGLCAGVLGIIALGYAVLALHMYRYGPELPDSNERVVVALAIFGAAAGFLPYNVNPAKIFLGDAGSMLLGLNAAILILMFAEANLVRWMIGALMVFGLPCADIALTLVRRWRNGKPLMQGDRSHFYDQLRDRGLSVRQVVAISYLLTIFFVLIGVSVIFLRTRHAILLYGVTIIVVAVAVSRFGLVNIERERDDIARKVT